MNGKQLKNSILQWAIQGKLVPQDPNDEPASVLLDKIRQEKERLIKEKKIKRDKNASIIYRGEDNSYYEKLLATGEVKCIDEEIPFEVPKGWEWCRFSSLYLSLTDGTHSTPKYTLTGIPFISVKDISSGIIDFSNTKYISKEEHQKLSDRCHPQKGDLLLSKVGTTGIPALVTTDKEFSLFVSVALIKLTQNKFSNEFLVFMILSPLVQEQAKENTRGVGNKNWVLSAVSKTLMVVPPLEEQERIKNRLNLVLPYIERYSSSQDKLDLLNVNIVTYLKKSILQEAIKGKLVPQIAEEGTAQELLEQIKTEKQKLVKEGKLKKSALNDSVIFRGDDNKYYEQIGKKCLDITDEIPFPIPNNWAWSRLSSMCSIVNGFTPLRSESKFWDCGTINWFTVEDIKNQGEMIYSTKQKITDEATSKERIVRAGSVLLCCTASVGQCALAKIDLTTNQQFNALTVKDVNRFILTDNYLFWFAKTLKATLQRLSGKTTFEFVSVKKVGNILIPIPPFQEQQRIVAQIEKLFEQLR
ncbi:restriction endonuclease subunit S [Segatella copri]|uniref:Restriction endonuclease subunit S n=1 Tax=Segatella copri TaxID=165179 RepID=A0AAW4N009_9BACT|nr:restriction endonuclease subunit S [Segatella copri]MBV3387335.1 restriction endonuclease subunit S [Segatella copri]